MRSMILEWGTKGHTAYSKDTAKYKMVKWFEKILENITDEASFLKH